MQATKQAARKAPKQAANPIAALAQVLTAPAPVAAPATAPTVLRLRGSAAGIAQVQLTDKPYHVTAGHNVAWWAQVQAAIAAGQGQVTIATLAAAPYSVPPLFVGYLVRRGYCKPVTA